MLVQKCEFDPIKDNTEVDQFGFVDLAKCLSNGVVPSEIADSEANYNEIDDPASIMGKPHDVFEAYAMKDYALKNGKKETNSTE